MRQLPHPRDRPGNGAGLPSPAGSGARRRRPAARVHGPRRNAQPGGALDFPRPDGNGGGPVAGPIPGRDGVTRGHLPHRSGLGRALGEDPVGHGPRGEGVRRQRGNAAGGRAASAAACNLWQKWSFPFNPFTHGIGDPPGWRSVHKRRRTSRFSFADGQIAASAQALAGEARCAVELTALRTGGQSWWSLGFEATGPADLLRGALEATATLVFAQPLPDGLRPGLDESTSYAEWLRHHPQEG